jgi:hypothetical protein
MTDVYLQLDYRAYKHLERQLLNWDQIETVHVSMDRRYYHKALRLEIGDLTLEIQGPAVREAVQEAEVPEWEEKKISCTCTNAGDQCQTCSQVAMYLVGRNIRLSYVEDAQGKAA